MKKLAGKTKEELEHILSTLEVSVDPSVLFSKAKAALRAVLWVFELAGFTFNYERLVKKSVLLRYLETRLPGVIGEYGEEFEIFTILAEEADISEREKNEKKEDRREPSAVPTNQEG